MVDLVHATILTSSDDEAEYSPLAPSTMNLAQIDNLHKSVGSEVEIMRESVLTEMVEEMDEELRTGLDRQGSADSLAAAPGLRCDCVVAVTDLHLPRNERWDEA